MLSIQHSQLHFFFLMLSHTTSIPVMCFELQVTGMLSWVGCRFQKSEATGTSPPPPPFRGVMLCS